MASRSQGSLRLCGSREFLALARRNRPTRSRSPNPPKELNHAPAPSVLDPLHQPKRKVPKPTRPLLLTLLILQTPLPQPIQRPKPIVPRRIRSPSIDPGISHLTLEQLHPVLARRFLKHVPDFFEGRGFYGGVGVDPSDLGEGVEDVLEGVRARVVVPPLEDDAGAAAGARAGRREMVQMVDRVFFPTVSS